MENIENKTKIDNKNVEVSDIKEVEKTPEEIAKEEAKALKARMKKLSKPEKKKLRVINKLINGEINGTKAAKMLGVTTRQVRNLKRQVLDEGLEGVVHKNKNYKPYNTFDTETSQFIVKLYRKEYRGTNFSKFARIIQEEYGIDVSRSTIYNFLRRGRIRSPQRKAKKPVKKYIEQTNENGEIVKVLVEPKKRTRSTTASKK